MKSSADALFTVPLQLLWLLPDSLWLEGKQVNFHTVCCLYKLYIWALKTKASLQAVYMIYQTHFTHDSHRVLVCTSEVYLGKVGMESWHRNLCNGEETQINKCVRSKTLAQLVAVIQNVFDFFLSPTPERQTDRRWGQWWGRWRRFHQMRLMSWTNQIPTCPPTSDEQQTRPSQLCSTSFTDTARNDGVIPRARQPLVRRWYAPLISSGWPSADNRSLSFWLSEQKQSNSSSSSLGAAVIGHSREFLSSVALNKCGPEWVQCSCHSKQTFSTQASMVHKWCRDGLCEWTVCVDNHAC